MSARLPTLFISHGSPMLAVDNHPATAVWQALAAALPEPPRAVLMVSAHWESGLPLLGGHARPETIHDFGGFPPELYRIHYPATGAPDLAQEALGLLRAAGFAAGVDGCRGLDHGAWIPMLKMYPQGEVPVLQLSVQPGLDAAHHYALGAALASLREQGVLIIGSGHMTHNLRDYFHGAPPAAANYASEFRDWIAARLEAGDVPAVLDWEAQAPYARRAHPSPEHFLPLFVALGAAGAGAKALCHYVGNENGVLAMDVWQFD